MKFFFCNLISILFIFIITGCDSDLASKSNESNNEAANNLNTTNVTTELCNANVQSDHPASLVVAIDCLNRNLAALQSNIKNIQINIEALKTDVDNAQTTYTNATTLTAKARADSEKAVQYAQDINKKLDSMFSQNRR